MRQRLPARIARIIASLACVVLGLGSLLIWNQPPWSTIVRVFWIGFWIYALLREPTPEQIRKLAGSNPAEQDEISLVQIAQGAEVPIAYGLLKAAGVPAVCQSSETFLTQQFPLRGLRPQGVPDLLLVPKEWKDKAVALLNSRVSETELESAAKVSVPPDQDREEN